MSILGNFFKVKKEEIQTTVENAVFNACAMKNPAFEGMDVTQIEFQPVDGNINRMAMYGCYAGDKFIYGGQVHSIQNDMVERITVLGNEEMEKRVYSGNMVFGDGVKIGDLSFYYEGYEIELESGYDEFGYEWTDTEKTNANSKNTWVVKCDEKTKPLVDVVIPDTVLGRDVTSIEDAFKGCRNLVSIAHIPQYIIDTRTMDCAFENSGLRIVPKGLDAQNILCSCNNAYALNGYEQIMFAAKQEAPNTEDKTGLSYAVDWQASAQKHREDKTKKMELMSGEFSPYQKFELVSFVYKFEPVRILRVQDESENWYAVSPADNSYISRHGDMPIVPYGEYMKKFDMAYVTDLTVSSFKELTPEKGAEVVGEAYDMMAERADREVIKHIENLLQDRQKAIDGANQAQGEHAIEATLPTTAEILNMIQPKEIERAEKELDEL